MNLKTRYMTERDEIRGFAIARDAGISLLALVLLIWFWPLRTVPTE